MRLFVIGIGLLAFVTGWARAQAPDNALTPEEAREGWTLLFDGKSLAGWEAHATSLPTATRDWTVEDRAIVCPGTSPGWLGTSRTYKDFILRLEFRGPAAVNSGVFVRSQKEGQPHVTGYEVQIWDFQPDGFTTGSLVGSLKAGSTRIIPGRWNSYQITADGDHYVIVLNGKTLLDGHDSKHVSAGAIGFQCQKDNKIEFRRIRLRPIQK